LIPKRLNVEPEAIVAALDIVIEVMADVERHSPTVRVAMWLAAPPDIRIVLKTLVFA
jgi:signal transduction histidine kinase